jgi:MFS family permease
MVDEANVAISSARQRRWPLLALNFFMADIQAGVGPFLGVFLAAHGWESGFIGTVMTIGGIAGMLVTAPAGAIADATTHKRGIVVAASLCTVIASGLTLLAQSFTVVAVSQIATAIAGALIPPAANAITLGIAHQAGFNRQNGKNQAFNHAGNLVGAALSGLLGWHFGLPAVFWLAAFFGAFAILSVLAIPHRAIDDAAARGLMDGLKRHREASGLGVLFASKPLRCSPPRCSFSTSAMQRCCHSTVLPW